MASPRNTKGRIVSATVVCALALMLLPAVSAAAGPSVESVPTSTIQLSAGKSIILKSEAPVRRVSVANPEVADFILVSPREIYVTAKAAGSTNLTLWQDGRVLAVYDLVVSLDAAGLKQQINRVLAGEKDLQVLATHDSVTLAGKVSNAASLNQALAVARAYAPEGKVQNLVQVGGVQQVMLEVRVAEMSRTLTRRLGINFGFTHNDNFGVSMLSGLARVVKPDDATFFNRVLGFAYSPAVNALFQFNTGDTTWTGFVDALKEDGLIKVLAEPTLITMSGQSANFLAGGEFPVPVPQGLGTVAIEYKPFGVGLSFAPIVLSDNKISMRVSPEVSELDFTTAITVEGFVVPGLRTRRTTTTIELGDGQSFAIAGLLKDNMRSITSKVPLLGELPILGALFQSKSFQKEETELVIIVTPRLVKPLDLRKQPLPTDYYIEPNDVEFYLMGLLEGKDRGGTKAAAGRKGALDGEFGHSIPKQ